MKNKIIHIYFPTPRMPGPPPSLVQCSQRDPLVSMVVAKGFAKEFAKAGAAKYVPKGCSHWHVGESRLVRLCGPQQYTKYLHHTKYRKLEKLYLFVNPRINNIVEIITFFFLKFRKYEDMFLLY